jgi:hypothetical protein
MGLLAAFADGSAIVTLDERPGPEEMWVDADGSFDMAVDYVPELEHYEKPSQSTFLHDVRPDEVIANPRNDYPSLTNVRFWIQPFWQGQTLNQDDRLGGNKTYLDNPMRGSGQFDYPGMQPIESYKVVTRRGNPISFTDFVDQSELYS